MATSRSVCNLALRKLGVTAAGRDARPVDLSDTFDALQAMYLAWISAGAFGRLRDIVPSGTNYTAQGGERVFRRNSDILEVTLPELVSDQYNNDYGHEHRGYYGTVVTIDTVGNETSITVETAQPIGYATPPRDGSAVVISDDMTGITASWIYDGHIKKWQQIECLTLDDEAPRSVDVQGLASCLALEVSDQFATDVQPQTISAATRYKIALTQRFGMDRVESRGVYC